MAKQRHRLSREEMVRGIRSAIRSSATPSYLKPHLRSRLSELEGGSSRRSSKSKKSRVGFLGWLQF